MRAALPLPPCAGATVHTFGLEEEDRAQAVHTVVTFPGPFAAGLAAAQQLEAKLLGSVPQFFDKRFFGSVHMEAVSAPFLVGGLHILEGGVAVG